MTNSLGRTGPVLNTRRAADYCGMAYQTLRNLLAAGEGPKVFKQGRLNSFYPADLDVWLAARLVDANEADGAAGGVAA